MEAKAPHKGMTSKQSLRLVVRGKILGLSPDPAVLLEVEGQLFHLQVGDEATVFLADASRVKLEVKEIGAKRVLLQRDGGLPITLR